MKVVIMSAGAILLILSGYFFYDSYDSYTEAERLETQSKEHSNEAMDVLMNATPYDQVAMETSEDMKGEAREMKQKAESLASKGALDIGLGLGGLVFGLLVILAGTRRRLTEEMDDLM